MKTKHKIILYETDTGIHLPHPFLDTTLCGEADEGGIDENENPPIKKTKKRMVTCNRCLDIIESCQEYILSL